MPTRRQTLQSIGLGAGFAAAGRLETFAQSRRTLEMPVVGFSLAIHIPAIAAAREILPTFPGYSETKLVRLDSLRVITQTIVSGSHDIGDGDAITTLRAVEAGANLKIIGLGFNSTSLVFVVNGKKIKELTDLQKPEAVVAVNSKGDFTHVMLIGPLLARGVDLSKVTVVEIGGSGARMRALIGGRVDAVPVHFDQAAALKKEGDYPVMIEPWKEYRAWFGEVYFATADWLAKPANERAAIDLIKATLVAFRRANRDFDWFAMMYRKHSTIKDAQKTTDETLRPVWETLTQQVKAWPDRMETLTVENVNNLVPVYKASGALAGTVDIARALDLRYLQQALKELG
jgi:NitT/TauT family transport system substrate-binding protein